MRGVIGHGILLVLMLGFAYQTWTRDKTIRVNTGDVSVWDQSTGELTAVEFESTKPDPASPTKSSQRTVRVERRSGAGGGDYWWGTETRTVQKPKAAPASGSDTPADTEASTTKREFPIGENFHVTGQPEPMKLDELLKDFASMHAVRLLGPLTDDQKKDFDLVDGNTTLAVIFKGKTHTLILGGKVSGSSQRYALDPDTRKAYILSGAMIDPLDTGESSLRPSTIHGYDPKTLASVTIAAGGKEHKTSRITATDEHGTSTPTWGDAATNKSDPTVATFVDNLDKLIPQTYEPTLQASEMTPVLTASYADASGKKIGVLGLYKIERPGDMPEDGTADPTNPPPPVMEYYVVTETTRVPAQVPKAQAERAEQDLATVFEPPAAPSTPAGSGSGSGSASAPAGSASTPAGSASTPVPAPGSPASPVTPQ